MFVRCCIYARLYFLSVNAFPKFTILSLNGSIAFNHKKITPIKKIDMTICSTYSPVLQSSLLTKKFIKYNKKPKVITDAKYIRKLRRFADFLLGLRPSYSEPL